MFKLEGRPRVERAIEWTNRHPVGGPFLLGFGAVAAVVGPVPVAMSLYLMGSFSPPIRTVLTIPTIVVALLPYLAFIATVVPGYVVGRSRGNGWLAAAGLVAPLAIPLAVAMMFMLTSFGGSALVAPLTALPFFIPFWLGLRRGRSTMRCRTATAQPTA